MTTKLHPAMCKEAAHQIERVLKANESSALLWPDERKALSQTGMLLAKIAERIGKPVAP